MTYKKHIERNPEVMLGKPVIKGTRITVELIMRKMAGGYSVQDILKSYPHLSKDQVYAGFEFAADMIANEDSLETA